MKYKNYLPAVIIVLLIIVSFIMIKPFLLAVFVGALLAYMTYPVYKFLLKYLKYKTVVALIICVLIAIIIVVPGVFFAKAIVQESYVLYLLVKQKLAVGLFKDCTHSFCETVRMFTENQQIQYQIQELTKAGTNFVIQKGSNLLMSIPTFVLNMFIMLFTLFYFLVDGKKLLKFLGKYFKAHSKNYQKVILRLKEIVRGVVFGYILVAFIQGIIAGLGFWIFGVPSPLFWGAVTMLLALIPLLGAWLVWFPASVIMFVDGLTADSNSMIIKAIGLFVYSAIFVSTLDNFIRPKLMGNKAKVHPVVILLGIFGGMLLIGPLGVIVGPLVLSLTVVLIEMYLGEKRSKRKRS